MNFVIPIQNQYAYNAIPRNQNLELKIDNHCNSPSKMLLIDYKGDCFVCGCEAWLPIPVGKITDFNSLDEVWSSPIAKALQNDIDQKLFTHCAVDRCGVKYRNISFNRYEVFINIDESCNLACPSCRTELKMLTSGPLYDIQKNRVHHIISLLERFDHPVHVTMSGNGDVLASSIMRPLIHSWRPKANQTLRLFTNGLLLKKQLTDSPIINHISDYMLSVDAGSAPVYEIVRQPGRWKNLIENLDFLKETVKKTKSIVLLKFTMQKANWQDLENFVSLCKKYEFNCYIHRLEDWGTFGSSFNSMNVLDPKHPDHQQALREIKRVITKYHTPWDESVKFENILHELTDTV
jgi:MoaA/NifB/PqqE/SkfB family radical SAM enzyme